MRGRTPAGPEYVDRLQGSDLAKERLKTVLETIAGNCRVTEACERLQICEQRFHQLRQQVLEAALTELEPRSPGRPAQTPSPAEDELRQLRAELAAKDIELRAARAREEIALTLPRIVPAPADDSKKKTRRRPRTRGKKKNT
jgi:hypothetical protein